MSQDNRDREGKRNSQMMKISFVSLVTVLLFMIELYEIINDPANLLAIGALGVFILASVYAEVFLIGKMNEKREKDQEDAFDNVYRSEKASYLLMRKYFDQMEKKMDTFSEQAGLPYKELIAAQKALAKVQINRNKQNANALLISNDKMLHKISSFQKEIVNANTNANISEISLSEQDKADLTEGNKDILAKQQEILTGLKELETSLRNEILESANKMASMKSQQMVTPEPQMPVMENSDLQPLNIENEFSFDSDLTSNQILENSSESDLDKLLMGIDGEISPEIQADSVMKEAELAPLKEEAESEPMTEELKLDSLEMPELGSLEMPEIELPEITAEPELGSLEMPEAEIPEMTAEPELGSLEMPEIEIPEMTAEPELGSLEMPEAEIPEMTAEPELGSLEMPEAEIPEMTAEPKMELPGITAEPELDSLEMPEMKLPEMTAEPELDSLEMPEMKLPEITAEPELSSLEIPEMKLPKMTAEPELGSLEMPEVEIPEMTAEPELSSLEMPEMELPKMTAEPELGSLEMPEMTAEPKMELPGVAAEPELDSLEMPEAEIPEMAAEPELGSLEEPELKASADSESVSMDLPQLETGMEAEETVSVTKEPELAPIMAESELDAMLQKAMAAESEHQTAKAGVTKAQVVKTEAAAKEPMKQERKTEPEKKRPMPDLSDPNHKVTPDELAAMVANLGSEPLDFSEEDFSTETKKEEIKTAESVTKEQMNKTESDESDLDQIMKAMDIDDILEQPVEDLDIDKILEVPIENTANDSDVNQFMSSDEIAALIANTNLLSEPEQTNNSDLPDLSDPGYVMNSDELAALIANM